MRRYKIKTIGEVLSSIDYYTVKDLVYPTHVDRAELYVSKEVVATDIAERIVTFKGYIKDLEEIRNKIIKEVDNEKKEDEKAKDGK